MEKPKINDYLDISYQALKSLSHSKVIPEPPVRKRGTKHVNYSFQVRELRDGEIISADLVMPHEFLYNITLSYKYFKKSNTRRIYYITNNRKTHSNLESQQPENDVLESQQSENDLAEHNSQPFLQISEGFSVSEIASENASNLSRRCEEEKQKERVEKHMESSMSRSLPNFSGSSASENANGNVLRMAISLAEAKVLHYEHLAANARNHLTRLKEKNLEDDPDDRIGTMKDIQIKALHEEYFKKMLDIFNDEPVLPYKFLNIWDEKYPALDFSMVQRLPLIITFKKDSEYENAFGEYLKGNLIFKLLDGRRVYGSLKIPMWEVNEPNTEKPTALNGAQNVARFALPFKNTAVLMYACRGFACRFYRPCHQVVLQHEAITGHFVESGILKGKSHTIKCEESSDSPVVEVQVTQSKEAEIPKNRRKLRNSRVFAKRRKTECKEDPYSSDGSVVEIIDLLDDTPEPKQEANWEGREGEGELNIDQKI